MKLPKTDSLILFAFLGCVALWAVSKCSARRSDLVRHVSTIADELEDRPVKHDTIYQPPPNATPQSTPASPPPSAPPPPPTTTPMPTPGKAPDRPVVQSTPSSAKLSPTPATASKTDKPAAPKDGQSILYVTIDELKLRKTPGLKGDVVTTLKLYDAVTFLGKKSEKAEEISLGYEKVSDHWVKVRTKSGKEGWVFGAGVHYYKMKRKGVMD